MMHFTIQPLEGTTGVYVITAGLPVIVRLLDGNSHLSLELCAPGIE